MAITDADIILQYQCASAAKEKLEAAERQIRRLDGETVTESSQHDDEELLYQRLELRNISRGELVVVHRESLLTRNMHLAKAKELREARDKEDAKSFFGRRRIKRRNKERARYLAQKQRKQA